jgi:hypothetical protein
MPLPSWSSLGANLFEEACPYEVVKNIANMLALLNQSSGYIMNNKIIKVNTDIGVVKEEDRTETPETPW